MKRILIGIHVHAEPARLSATLAALRAHTTLDFELLLLPDGPDAATKTALARTSDLPQAATAEPLGVAACFNRLANYNDAGVVVLLESGALVGPQWLNHLLAALDADPRNGLAGPSTNRSWNEQNIRARCSNSTHDIARVARDTERRFASETRVLEPLYSLSDFCYAVRREVIEAIGRRGRRLQTRPVLGDGLQRQGSSRRFPWSLGLRRLRAPHALHRAAQAGGSAVLRGQ